MVVYYKVLFILITYTIEPYLWIKSMSVSGRRFENRFCYLLAMLGYYLISSVKQAFLFLHINNRLVRILGLALSLYIFILTIILFEGEKFKKVMNCSVFCFLTCLSELITISVYVFCFHIPFHTLMQFGNQNFTCTILAKLLLIGLCKLVFENKDMKILSSLYGNPELLYFIILNYILEIPTTSMLRHEGGGLGRPDNFFILAQIMLVCNLLYIVFIVYRKDKKLMIAEEELKHLSQIMMVTENLRKLKHDMQTHMRVIAGLIDNESFDELRRYVQDVAGDIQQAKRISVVSDPALATVLEHFINEAERCEIVFCRHIMIHNFNMSSKDLCSIVSNMLNNAKEATSKLSAGKRYISLDIFPAEGGYYITCMNPYKKEDFCFRTTKQDKYNHGFGLKIIKETVEKYHGAMEIVPNEKNWFEITCFIPV